MNKVFANDTDVYPLTNDGLAKAACENTRMTIDYAKTLYPQRIEGCHCACNGNGEFVLMPYEEGQKRYMKCRICGCVSHL